VGITLIGTLFLRNKGKIVHLANFLIECMEI